jgi:hypothetical protein
VGGELHSLNLFLKEGEICVNCLKAQEIEVPRAKKGPSLPGIADCFNPLDPMVHADTKKATSISTQRRGLGWI